MTAERPARVAATAAVATVVLLVLGGADAAADVSKDECVDSNAMAQSLRRQGRFSEAREKLRLCTDAACPSLVRDDCTERLDELDRAQPTVVVVAKDGDGNDVIAVKLTVDGRVVAERLAGTAIPLDPGAHTFVFEAAGWQPLSRRFVLMEGEKDRRERVMLVAAPSAAAPSEPPPTAPTTERPESSPADSGGGLGTRKVAAIVVAGLGVASVTTGAVLGLSASAAYDDQKRDCSSPTDCVNHAQALSDHATMQTDATWSTVAFVAGGALIAGGAWLFFTGGRSASAPSSTIGRRPDTTPALSPFGSIAVVPTIGRDNGAVVVRGEF
jgi:hypothetical protein